METITKENVERIALRGVKGHVTDANVVDHSQINGNAWAVLINDSDTGRQITATVSTHLRQIAYQVAWWDADGRWHQRTINAELRNGAKVCFVNADGTLDDQEGEVSEYPPINPHDGQPDDSVAEVIFGDDWDLVEVNRLRVVG